MRKLTMGWTVALVAALAGLPAVAGGHEGAPTGGVELASPEQEAGSRWNMAAVGHHPLGYRGYNADVWVHERYAYVGSWGFSDYTGSTEQQRFCPEPDKSGIAVVDTRTPSAPKHVATLRQPAGTSVEDVVVFTAKYGRLAGRDIAAAGVQVCGGPRTDTAFFRGLLLWDVTNPARPVELARLDTGCCTRGLHEFEVQHRPDLRRTFVYASVPTSEYPDGFGRRDRKGRGDFRLIDVTDPKAPVETADWGVHKNLGMPPAAGIGCDPDPQYGHSAEPSADGRAAYVAYWDSGFIKLDLTNPGAPAYRGRTVYESTADGDAHSSQYDEARRLLFTADEDFCKTSGSSTEKGFGYLRVYDSASKQIGTFKTPNSSGARDVQAGDYTIHNPLLAGTDLYVSWYTDGIRVLDTRNPRAPVEVANFVPPAKNNPVKPSQRGTLTNATQVWGVAYDESTGLIYASDMNSGLWILRRTDR